MGISIQRIKVRIISEFHRAEQMMMEDCNPAYNMDVCMRERVCVCVCAWFNKLKVGVQRESNLTEKNIYEGNLRQILKRTT